jgi:hypothetical protein
VASVISSGRANRPPRIAIASASRSVTVMVVPATAFTRSGSPAPQAWPIMTEAPALRPMTKEMKKNITGKNTDAAASASTPIIWPR